jgi:hypothetical protein
METVVELAMMYFAIGAACFAYPAKRAIPDDFHWRNQIGIFRSTLPEVLCWPLHLWRFFRTLG